MKPRLSSIDLATRVVLLPSLCLIALVAFAATAASRDSRQSLQEGASYAASMLADGVVGRLQRTGRAPEAPAGTTFRLLSHQGDDIFEAPNDAHSFAAMERVRDTPVASWLDSSGDGRLRLRYAQTIQAHFDGEEAPRSGVLLLSMTLDGADDSLFERAVMRTALLIFVGVVIFATMISCVRWMGVARLTRERKSSDVGRELAQAAADAEAAEESAMTRLLREAEELAEVAAPAQGPDEEVQDDLQRLHAVAERLRHASDRLGAVAINCAVGAARSKDFDTELFNAADSIRQLADANREAAEQILGVCDANESADDASEAFARVGFLLKVAHEAAQSQQAHRDIASQIASVLNPGAQNVAPAEAD